MYDYLVVGAGLYGAVFAQQAKAHGKSVLVIDKRDHIAGNVYSKKIEGIEVHQYGAHIFHGSARQTVKVCIPIEPRIEQKVGLLWRKSKYTPSGVESFISFVRDYPLFPEEP